MGGEDAFPLASDLSVLVLLTFGAGEFFVLQDLLLPCGMLRDIPGLCPLDVSSKHMLPPPLLIVSSVSRCHQVSLVELRTTRSRPVLLKLQCAYESLRLCVKGSFSFGISGVQPEVLSFFLLPRSCCATGRSWNGQALVHMRMSS